MVAHDNLLALDQTLMAVERAWSAPHPVDASERFYGREPLPAHLFLAGMDAVGPAGGRRFLDAGCGVGTKLHLARMLGWESVAGFDRHPPYLEQARQLCPWAHIEEAQAHDYRRYREVDVVYCYRLCVDDDDELELERLIVSRMRPGAIAFFPQGLARDLGEPLATDVWRVG